MKRSFIYNGAVVYGGGYKTSGKIVASLYDIKNKVYINKMIGESTYLNFKKGDEITINVGKRGYVSQCEGLVGIPWIVLLFTMFIWGICALSIEED